MNAFDCPVPRKNVGYAYPSSPMADELGYGATGCWYVSRYIGQTESDPLLVTESRDDAIAYAKLMLEPWHKYSFREQFLDGTLRA